jgi:Transcriptional regulator
LGKREKLKEFHRSNILEVAKKLFLENGFIQTTMDDIAKMADYSKSTLYVYFKSKEEIMHALGDQMFLDNNPFEAVKRRTDLNGLQKIREMLTLNQSDTERVNLYTQSVSILEDPHILAAAIDANQRVLTPLWFELLEEGRRDGSIQTEYSKELSELLPLLNFWLMPSVYPATAKELQHKFHFIVELLTKMGLPLYDEKMIEQTENI